jgi:hypothetical protein
MAQWYGQFTGNTHATRESDATEAMTHAARVFLAASEEARAKKKKVVRRLAQKLLAARLRRVRAELHKRSRPFAPDAAQHAKLLAQEARLFTGGVEAVLTEFGLDGLV